MLGWGYVEWLTTLPVRRHCCASSYIQKLPPTLSVYDSSPLPLLTYPLQFALLGSMTPWMPSSRTLSRVKLIDVGTWTTCAFKNAFCREIDLSLGSAQESLLKRTIHMRESASPWYSLLVKQRKWISHHFKSCIFVLRNVPVWSGKRAVFFIAILTDLKSEKSNLQ